MYLALSKSAIVVALALASQVSLANLSHSNADVLRAAAGPAKARCSVEVLDSENHEVNVFSKDLELVDGATLETPVGSYSVLIQAYVSKIQDDGTPNTRLEIQINSEKQQEDYINSSVKPIVFLSSLKGELKGEGQTMAFEGILIDCAPMY